MPSTFKTENFFKKTLYVGYVYIEESFDTILNMGCGGGGHGVWVGKIAQGQKG